MQGPSSRRDVVKAFIKISTILMTYKYNALCHVLVCAIIMNYHQIKYNTFLLFKDRKKFLTPHTYFKETSLASSYLCAWPLKLTVPSTE